MGKFKNPSDFLKRQESLVAAIDPDKSMVMLCGGTGCTALGSSEVYRTFEAEIERMQKV